MTAIKKFNRLESKAVWIEDIEKSPKKVIVSFGKSSIIISDENELPLDHWSFSTIKLISKTEKNTIFSQETNKSEKLIIEDNEMINAIILIINSKKVSHKYVTRLNKLLNYFFSILLILLLFFFPDILRKIILEITTPKNEIVFYDKPLNELKIKGEICYNNEKIAKFEKRLNDSLNYLNHMKIIIIKYGLDNPKLLPGGRIIIPFNWLKNEKSYKRFNELISIAVEAYKERYVFKKFLKEQTFLNILVFTFGRSTSFDLDLNSFNWNYFFEKDKTYKTKYLEQEEWINIKNICYN